MRIHFAAMILAGAFAHKAIAQSTAHSAADSPVGVWRGTSTCLVRPSACHDEVVVYRITQTKGADSVSVDALKIVDGQEDDMGLLACRLVAGRGQISCIIPHGIWSFTARGDSLTGELRSPDNTKIRDVRAARSR